MREVKVVTPDGVELTIQVDGDEDEKPAKKAPAKVADKARPAANKARSAKNK